MKKRLTALLLVATMILSLSSPVLANIQLAVDDLNIDNVFYVVGENIVTGDPIINPTIALSWEDPEVWANDIEVHDPNYYEIVVNNLTFNTSETIKILGGETSFDDKLLDLHNEMNLETGSFYDISIEPFHYHTIIEDDEQVIVLAPQAEEPFHAYAVTDLHVEFISGEDSIQVIWDDVGLMDVVDYRIVYATGDYSSSTKQSLLDNKEGEISHLTKDSDDVTSYYDPIEQRDKLTYIIDENIYPGQVYSVMVEPVAEYYNGDLVERNRNYPYIQSVSTNIELSLVEEGDYLRLQWEIPSSFQVGQDQNEYALVEATLSEFQDGSGSNLVIFDGDAAAIGYYRISKPIWETSYQLDLIYRAVDDTSKPDITPSSNLLGYVPSDYLIQPTKPYVPEVLSSKIIEDLKDQYDVDDIYPVLEEKYLVPGYSYGDNIDDLLDQNVTFHVDYDNTAINFVWGAFQRIDVDETSPTYGSYIYDNNVYYDIWVTDQLSTLAYAPKRLDEIRYSQTSDSHVLSNAEEEIIGFKQQFNFYYDTDSNELLEIVPNQIYYIKVQAKKITAQGTLLSEPTIVTVYYTYGGDAYEPPTIAKPPLKVKDTETSTTSVTFNWREHWYEAISPDLTHPHPLANWQHQLWVDDTGNVYTEVTDNTEYFALFEGEHEIDRLKDYLTSAGVTAEIISREMDLGTDDFGVSDVKYNFKTVLYQTVQDEIEEGQLIDPDYNFEDYYNKLVLEDKDGTSTQDWQELSPYSDPDDSTYLAHRQENLTANTSYLFILYPYRVLKSGEILYAHYPTPIIISTLPEEVAVTPDPTVPTLYTTNPTDMSIRVTWRYNTDFEYQLMYGLEEDVTKAEAFDLVLPENELDPSYPQDGDYYEVVIDDLFPLTTYYFWIKAIQTSNNTQSLWSNPSIGNTIDVDAPIPPKGLGLAPESVIDDYGYSTNVTEDYLIVQWIKDLDDVDDASSGRVVKTYTYIVEIADNPKFIDPVYVESSGGSGDIVPTSVEVLEKNLLKVNELVGNRHYYVRAKTKVVVTGDVDGQLVTKSSDTYTVPIRIITLSNGDEYDGYIDPALTILPQEDYELIYNDVSKSLEFRFRSDQNDADGGRDNQVDQRLISSLITDNVHEYVIDLNSFKDQEIERRRVTIPYAVIEAFSSHNVDIKILADNMQLDVAVEGVIGPVNSQVASFGVAPSLIIDMEDLDSDTVMEELAETSLKDVAVPQSLQMKVSSSRKTDPIYYSDTPMTMALKTKTRYDVYEKDLALYVKDNKANWSQVDGSYDNYTAMMAFDTPVIGSYGLYAYDRSADVAGNNNPSHWSEMYRKQVYEAVTIEGFTSYNPEGKVSEKAMVQATYGTVTDRPVINLSDTLDTLSMQTLQRSGIKATGTQSDGTIRRQEAISMFVRTAEIANGTTIEVTPEMVSQARSAGADSPYASNIAKAKALGLISDLNNLRANEPLKYGEYFTLWSRVLN